MINPITQPSNAWYDGIAIVRVTLGALLIAQAIPFLNGDTALAVKDHIVLNKDLSMEQVARFGPVLIQMAAGLLLVAGLFTRAAAAMLFVTFMFSTFVMGEGNVFSGNQLPFVLGLTSLLFFFTGAGRVSVDYLRLMNRRDDGTENQAVSKTFGRYVTKG